MDGPECVMISCERSLDLQAKGEKLPAIMLQRNSISVWSILKQSIGKELSKITMPVVFNEPVSFLQRLTEYMEYGYLIKKASNADDALARMELVAAFAVSALASNWERLGKPFNPLLGETYELDRQHDLGFRIVCEQVSHHPPVSAFHADSPSFRFYGSIYPKLRFWGRSVEIQPKGTVTLELLSHNEVYTWSNVNCSVHNLMIGKLWIEQHGVMEITCHQTGLKCVLNFKPSSQWFSKETNHIEGFIFNKSKTRLRALYGAWTEILASCDVNTFDSMFTTWGKEHNNRGAEVKEAVLHRAASSPSTSERYDIDSDERNIDNHSHQLKNSATPHVMPILPNSNVLWKAFRRPLFSKQFYEFTSFAMMLNELNSDLHINLPPTDCRLRPDIRCMEEGDIDKASEEKNRLENKQRDTRATRKKAKDEWSPRWFKLAQHPFTKEEFWQFTHEYWARDWSRCDEIF